jgi:endo-1,4-beta-xylanase
MNSTKPILLFILLFSIFSCKTTKESVATTSLKETFKNDFVIGTAINDNQILEKDAVQNELIKKEYNTITAENIMKSMYVHPSKDVYDFAMTDKFVAYGEKNKMFIHGHTLVWHSQLSPWIEVIKDKAEMEEALKSHITTIVTKYKGRIDSWDVVNEALNEDGTLRKSVFLNVYGEDYLTLAFKTAAKADPKVDLYYNDYNITRPEKRKGTIAMIKKIQANGGKIDGVGIQAHWGVADLNLKEIEESIQEFSALGLKVAFTELDITVLPNPWDLQGADVNQNFEGSEKMNPFQKGFPEAEDTDLAKKYADVFTLFLKYKDNISRVTFWGLNDGQSWLNDWPIKGRTNYPLLFDRNFKPKKAYYSVIETKTKK